MIALQVIMIQKLVNAVPQRILTKEDHSLKTLFLDRSYESFRVGIAESRQLQIVWETRQGGSE